MAVMLEGNRELLERFRRGEPAALTAVYRAYAPGLARMLAAGFQFRSDGKACWYRGARSPADREDRVHEAFLRAFSDSARHGYDGLTPYGAYLARITKNLVIDEFRKKSAQVLDFYWEPPEPPPQEAGGGSEPLVGAFEPSGDPEMDIERAELGREVSRIVESLPERERVVYRLRFVEELEHTEVADRTGFSISQVKTSERRIRSAFYSRLSANGYFAGYEEEPRGWLRWRFARKGEGR